LFEGPVLLQSSIGIKPAEEWIDFRLDRE